MHVALESIMDDLDLTTFLVAQCKQGISTLSYMHVHVLHAHQKVDLGVDL